MKARGFIASIIRLARGKSNVAAARHTKVAEEPLTTANTAVTMDGSEAILKNETDQSHNAIPNLGFFANVDLALFDQNVGTIPVH
jgi:hypothetical protein